ncbi:hypothetical protein K9L97_05015 [Candidatus Woesearchaeota archaeon]|nr:hypothetical protein [Candidatus Woesearchaeota archaeon]
MPFTIETKKILDAYVGRKNISVSFIDSNKETMLSVGELKRVYDNVIHLLVKENFRYNGFLETHKRHHFIPLKGEHYQKITNISDAHGVVLYVDRVF